MNGYASCGTRTYAATCATFLTVKNISDNTLVDANQLSIETNADSDINGGIENNPHTCTVSGSLTSYTAITFSVNVSVTINQCVIVTYVPNPAIPA